MDANSALLIPHNLAGVKYNVRLSEEHTREARMTEQTVENGAIVSDHVILLPYKLNVEFEQTNAFGGVQTAQQAYDGLMSLWKERSPFTVVTFHATYDSMIIEKMTAIHKSPNKGALKFNVTLKQVNKVAIDFVAAPNGKLSALAAAKQTDGGFTNPFLISANFSMAGLTNQNLPTI